MLPNLKAIYCFKVYNPFIPFNRLPNETRYLVLVATSGDTGSAVLHGFQNCENVAVMVLYPDKGISPIQRQQMTSMDARNVKVLGVQADFDFCQTAVKQIFVG
jgi:threonine synthase